MRIIKDGHEWSKEMEWLELFSAVESTLEKICLDPLWTFEGFRPGT